MKERMLVLAKATPTLSKKYQELVCIAGITDKGEWRRIYPVRWECFWQRSDKKFSKKQWIEYETEVDRPSDHRKESRKVREITIKPLNEARFSEIKDLIKNRITTLEKLQEVGVREESLGVIKPLILDFVEEKSDLHEKAEGMKPQKTLFGKEAVRLDVPEKQYSYIFYCSDTCRTKHKLLCEDWELTELYRNCKQYRDVGVYKDDNELFLKIKQRMLEDMLKKNELYFVVGSHYRFPSFMIVGVLYPKKGDI